MLRVVVEGGRQWSARNGGRRGRDRRGGEDGFDSEKAYLFACSRMDCASADHPNGRARDRRGRYQLYYLLWGQGGRMRHRLLPNGYYTSCFFMSPAARLVLPSDPGSAV